MTRLCTVTALGWGFCDRSPDTSLKLHGSDFDWQYSPPTLLQPHRVSVDSDRAYSWGGRVPHDYTVQPGEVLHDVVGWTCDDPTAPLAKLHLVPRHLITMNASGVPTSSSSAPRGSSAAPRELTVNPAHLHAPTSTVLATQQAAGATVTQGTHPTVDADLVPESTNVTQQQDPRQPRSCEELDNLMDSGSPLTELESTGEVVRDDALGPPVKVKCKVQLRERVVVEICTWSHAKAAAASPVPSSSRRTRSSR
ncbi:hypothetical protein BJ165DRAFT_1534335 [Panaeolus papilionaceus]|nr:hypothetical protein BJ165DRAFT_1534335 [Panaeolus papilionaceus]